MTLPRFTLRTALLGLTAGAAVALVVREAVLGEAWALGAVVGLASVGLSFGLQALLMLASLALSRPKRGPER